MCWENSNFTLSLWTIGQRNKLIGVAVFDVVILEDRVVVDNDSERCLSAEDCPTAGQVLEHISDETQRYRVHIHTVDANKRFGVHVVVVVWYATVIK